MRTEVKRSLLLWPIAASTTITAMSWISVAMPSAKMSMPSLMPKSHVVANQIESRADCLHSLTRTSLPIEFSDDFVSIPRSRDTAVDRPALDSRGVRLPDRVADVFGRPHRSKMLAPRLDTQNELAGLALQLRQSTEMVVDAVTLESLNAQRIEPNQFELTPASVAPRSVLPPSNRGLAKPARIEPPVMESFPGDVDRRGQSSRGSFVTDLPQMKLDLRGTLVSQRSASDWPAGWPATKRLHEQLQSLSMPIAGDPGGGEAGATWANEVSDVLTKLHALPRLGAPAAGDLIEELARLATDGEAAAEAHGDREEQVQWLRAVHALHRRVQVWRPVWQVVRDSQPTWMVTDQIGGSSSMSVSVDDVISAIETVQSELAETGDAAGWKAYLLLDEIRSAAAVKYRDVAKREERSLVAQRLLSRLSWHALQEQHLRWLDRSSVRELADSVRPWARGAVDYADLLSQIERQESDTIDLASIDIADAVQTLRFADNAGATAIADSLGSYYRNANVRLAISQDMLSRMLPSIDPKSVRLNTTMLGSRVRGTSHINSDLAIQLSPSPDSWQLHLKTLGHVSTQSVGFKGPVAVRTDGSSRFVAATPIVINRNGIVTGNVSVDVNSNTRLRGIQTDYDHWPLVGSLVRSIAENRFDEVKPLSTRLANRKIESEVASEIETRLDEQVGSATEQLSMLVLGPLGKLHLNPQVIDMQTTGDRLLARYRLAGDWQLAAFTPRPRAPKSSLMSLQIHQSAINNTLEQLVPRDQPMAIEKVVTRAAKLFGQEIELPDDLPAGVTIQFARTRPITVEIEDGRLWVTMRIVRLAQDGRLDLTQFIVRAAYVPQTDGLNASLARDGHLRISGPSMSMRERLPVRAIFNKVLATNRSIPLTLPVLVEHPAMEGLAVSQLELRGGWIGIAVSEQDAPRVAMQVTD